jgi:hypothetical protein
VALPAQRASVAVFDVELLVALKEMQTVGQEAISAQFSG